MRSRPRLTQRNSRRFTATLLPEEARPVQGLVIGFSGANQHLEPGEHAGADSRSYDRRVLTAECISAAQ